MAGAAGRVQYAGQPDTPLGMVWAAAAPAGLVAVGLQQGEEAFVTAVTRLTGAPPEPAATGLPLAALAQLVSYLHGQRQTFDLPLDWGHMTPFQVEVLRLVLAVPYGERTTYGELAQALGRPGAARAVGRANATNPLPLVIPCHRVLGSDGRLHGYGAGIEVKAWLLRLEGSWLL